MNDKIAILVIGKQNSGKTSVWKKIIKQPNIKVFKNIIRVITPFKDFPELKLEVFIQGQSPTELKKPLKKILEEKFGKDLPKIILCSEQSSPSDNNKLELEDTIKFLEKAGYKVEILLIEHGHGPKGLVKKPTYETNEEILALNKKLCHEPPRYSFDDNKIIDWITNKLSDYINQRLI